MRGRENTSLWLTGAKDERGKDIFIRQADAASYLTEDFYAMLGVFNMVETLGCLPFAGGWAEQPAWIAQSLAVLKLESSLVDREEREKGMRDAETERKLKK
jgi:hypothetical protein